MRWEKINDNEYHGFEWEDDQSEEMIRAILVCDDPGIGFRCDTVEMMSVLDSRELYEIANKLDDLNKTPESLDHKTTLTIVGSGVVNTAMVGGNIEFYRTIKARIKELLTRPRKKIIVGVKDYGGYTEVKIEDRKMSWSEWRQEVKSIVHDLFK